MLTIRRSQMETLGSVPRKLWMMGSLRELFPGDWGDASDTRLEQFVKGSMARACARGFEGDDDLAWAALEHVLGEDFPSMPEHAWAAELLADRKLPKATAIQRLREAAILRLAYPPLPDEAMA
jgi:hypothetical protein